jgi:O-antigen/teichoic acid export membrane protein
MSQLFINNLLGTSGSLRHRFLTGTIWNTISTILVRGFGLIGSIAAARLLGKEKFGEFGIIISTVNTLAFMSSVSMSVTSSKFLAEYRDTDKIKTGRMASLCWLTAIIFGLISSGVLAVSAVWTSTYLFNAPHLATILAYSSLVVLLGAMTGVQNGMFIGLEAFKSMTILSCLNGFIYFGMLIFFTWKMGLPGAVLALILSYSINWAANSFILKHILIKLRIKPTFKGIWGERKILLSFSLPHMIGSFLNLPVTWFCNTLLVRQPDGMAQMGVYSAASRWRELVLFLPNAISPVAAAMHAERIGHNDRKSIAKLLRSSLIIVAVSASGGAIILALASRFIMSQYGNDFLTDGVPVMLLVLATAFIESLTVPFSNLVTSGGKIWLSLAIGIVRSTVLVACVWCLIGSGASGLAIALLISAGVSLCLLPLVAKNVISKK